ncbi:Ferredoxin--NAD(P)(+) reductase [Enhygromyxa salina]|uniref:Ferredoxin--NAD(P)(+) reductase n=1 Tax=Enhygromyxa salina TaxID=215803 RepID=A0A2S9XRL8_9BACT|nr:2Fe-2S iron-sulfur cluster-binding protein [Enhygromyxa salina]PRP95512.1 Ferredoxin--NAD(P)(+) reductase [Enhygromyxa salina]
MTKPIQLRIGELELPLNPGESVLDALLRGGVEVPHACRSGVCGSCTMVCTSGELPEQAQAGLREVEREQGLFLACQCHPRTSLELERLGDDAATAAEVVEHTWLSDSVVRLRLRPRAPLTYAPGQYLPLARADGLTRSYSLASVPSEDLLEFHVRRVPDGRMSRWLCDEVGPGTQLTLMRPRGSCCYPSNELDAPLLLVGVGTGLAPLWGVVREALARGHRGPITLIQAGARPASLYMRDELQALAQAHAQLRVHALVLDGAATEPGLEQANVVSFASQLIEASETPAAWLSFVCGDAEIVKALRLELFLAGVGSRRILADAFVMTPPSDPSQACA